MKAFVIRIEGHEYSERVANRCIDSANKFGIVVEKFKAITRDNAREVMLDHDIKWGWAKDNTTTLKCKHTGLLQFPYKTADLNIKIACSMSHYKLWTKCIEANETFLILEHDAVFIRKLPDIDFKFICQINDPSNATRLGNWWSQQMKNRGGNGVFEKTWVTTDKNRDIPDGLAGNSAYLIKPHAAFDLVNITKKVGLWPNDAIMCKQLFPDLEEYYPFITTTKQEQSTTISL